MKKKALGFLTLLMLLGSTISMSPITEKNIESEYPASCFEIAHYYADWFCSGLDVGSCSSFDKLEIVLAFSENCENLGLR
jgi:hypothetical protein